MIKISNIMKISFLYLLNENIQRNFYVVHQINDQIATTILNKLQENDILFFDDCLYSQYLFLKKYNNILAQKHIYCILSFSTNIYRHTGEPVEYADCAICHDKFHAGDLSVLQCYMSLDEVKELLKANNVYLACHGHNHLQLEKLNNDKKRQAKLFNDDLKIATNMLKTFNMQTNIFVYPYEYDNFYLAQHIVNVYKYTILFGDNSIQRIYI